MITNNFDVGLTKKTQEFVAIQLNILLADHFSLFVKLLKYHWNITGQFFGPLHSLFEKGYEMTYESIDTIAERIVQVGFQANGTLSEFTKNTRLKEEPGVVPEDKVMISNLVKDFESIIIQIRELATQTESNYKDLATNNFLATLLEKYEKYVWLLRAHIS